MTERDNSITTITGWMPPGAERILQLAAQISAERGYNYLADEHLLLAMLDHERSFLRRIWPADAELTVDQLREKAIAALPPVQRPETGPTAPVHVETEWFGPHADEITRR
ncbi:Clp protease N-terminal domain-containing protein [Nocardia camponoti]|uniref:Clp R domain-containing protein n=1 Tax=Nocardia camponoti TaxID=1616106 RepID=A0A917V6D7_9NOCA|nr:Clp protease N-terminal domain-containing protein [Nocardia camponoti]GGK43328.1 hypothetical protein GCM10011591_13730 [Nocardia camponoti]